MPDSWSPRVRSVWAALDSAHAVMYYAALRLPRPLRPSLWFPSLGPTSRRKDSDLPGYWLVLFIRATANHPAECHVPSPIAGTSPWLSGFTAPWATRNSRFSGPTHAAHMLAHPRFNHSLPRALPGSLPAGGASPSPGGFCTRWKASPIFSPLLPHQTSHRASRARRQLQRRRYIGV